MCLKILFMANVEPNPNSGAAGTELQTINAMQKLGHKVDAIWQDNLSHIIKHGNLHNLIELPIAYRRIMRERLRLTDYDVIHVDQPHGYLAAKALISKKCVFIHRSQ